MKYLAFLIIEFATTLILETFEIILIMECDKITMRLLRLWSYRLNILYSIKEAKKSTGYPKQKRFEIEL